MALRYYANAPATTLASGCTALATSIVVSSTTGLPTSYPFTLIIDRGLSTEEAVEVTNGSGTTLTVTRGVDSTTAFAHSASAEVVHGITARDLREPNAHIEATVAHGATGAVVGTTNTQTLTNKTLTSPVLNGDLTGTGLDWQDWTPTWTAITVGNGAVIARYCLIGKTVHFRLRLIGGSTSSTSGNWGFTLPFEPVDEGAGTTNIFTGGWYDVSAATFTPAFAVHFGGTDLAMVARLLSGAMALGSTIENGDTLHISGTYEIS